MMVSYGNAARYGPETAGSWVLDSDYPNPSNGTVVLNGALGDTWVHDPCAETVCLQLNLR